MNEMNERRITEAEWEVMRIVWTLGEVKSSEVISILEPKMNWKQATIKTLLGRLVEKGALAVRQEGKKYIYTANIQEEDQIQTYTRSIFSKVCRKEAGKVIGELIREQTLSFDDIHRLEELLQEKKKTAVEEVECQCVPGQCQCQLNHGLPERM